MTLATYDGADRAERLLVAARKEGTVTFYTSIAEKDLPVIIEGVTVLRQFASMNLAADFVVYVDNARAPSLQPEYENQFKEYEAEFAPRQRADFTLLLDHEG